MKHQLTVLFACALLTVMAWASGSSGSITGTVVKITSSAITVKSGSNKPVAVMTDNTTTYESVSQENITRPGTRNEIRAGERIMIHTEEKNGRVEATLVQYMPNTESRN